MGNISRVFGRREMSRENSKAKEGVRRALVTFRIPLDVLAFMCAVAVVTFVPTSHAAFQGTNGKIAFVSNSDGNPEIWIMNADGSFPIQLTTTGCEAGPRWSPDGTKITFTSCRDTNQEIYVMNADGSGQNRLTNDAAQDRFSHWSADGTKIIFQSDRNNAPDAFDIYTINVDGTGLSLLIGTSRRDQSPAWAPDNSKIVFVDSTDCCDHRLKTMNTDGTSPAFLSPSLGSLNSTAPEWSPDSQTIAFSGVIPGLTNVQVYTIKADGTSAAETLLTPPASLTTNDDPAYSPDGTKISFHSNRDGNFEIYVMNADGSSPANLTNSPSSVETSPDWQPISQVPVELQEFVVE